MASVVGPLAKMIQLVFPSFTPSLIKIHPFRPHKETRNVKKITQLEGEGLQSLKIDDDNSQLRRVSDFCLQVDFRVSVWLSFGRIFHKSGSWYADNNLHQSKKITHKAFMYA